MNGSNNEEAVFQVLERQEEAIRREEIAQKRTMHVSVLSLGILLAVLVFFVYYAVNQNTILANTIKEFTYVNHQFAMKDLDTPAQKEIHQKMMMRIFTAYGYAYDPQDVRAFTKEQKVTFVTTSFDIACDLQKLGAAVGFYDAAAAGIMESSLNPREDGRYGEKGFLQFKWATAVIAFYCYQQEPDWFKAKYKIDLKKFDDLYDPYVSTVLFYCYRASLLREYRGNDMWAMAEYHWGLSLLGHCWHDGDGDLPGSIILGGVKYSVPSYPLNWISLRTTFENGMLEEGQDFKRNWQLERERMIKEEANLNNASKVINKLKNEKKDALAALQEAQDRIAAWDSKEENAYLQLREIYAMIGNGNYTNVRQAMNTHIPVMQEWITKYEKSNRKKRDSYFSVAAFTAGVSFVVAVGLFIIVLIFIVIPQLNKLLLRRFEKKGNRLD